MRKHLHNFLNGFLSVFLLIMLVLNFYTILQRNVMKNDMPKIFGYSYAVVISGSMEPEIQVKDIVYVKEQDSYAVGDVITYEKYGAFITHRIIDIVDGEYVTKGDSNNAPDKDTVMLEQVRGKVVFVLPILGAMVLYMKTPIGTLVTLLVALLCLEVPYQIRLSKARKKGKKKFKRIARDMERIQDEIRKLDEEAATNPDMPQQQMIVDDPELQYQTFLEQMLQAESINDIRLPGGLAPAKPLEGELVIGGSTEADEDYVNRVAAKNAREKVDAERAALLAQGYTFASAETVANDNGADGADAADLNAETENAAEPQVVVPEKPVELDPGSAMAAMMSIASAMNTDLGLTYEDFEKGNEELLNLEAELYGLPEEEVSENPECVAEDADDSVGVAPEDNLPYQPSDEAEAYAQTQVEEAYAEIIAAGDDEADAVIDAEEQARLKRIAEIEAELYGTPVDGEETEECTEQAEYAETEEYAEQVENSETEEYAEQAEYDETAECAECEETPQIDEEELARLRRIAEIEAELNGTEYVDPLDTMNLQEAPEGIQEISEDLQEEYVYDAPLENEVTAYVDEEELARLRRIAEIEAELNGTEYVDPLDTMDLQEAPEEISGDVQDEYEAQEEYVPETPVEYSAEEIVAYAESAEEYAEVVPEEEVSNEQFAVTDFVPEEPQGYAAAGGYVIDEEELARLRRIAEIEAELYGTEYVDPLETMQLAQDENIEATMDVDMSVSEEYAEIMQEEYVPDVIVGYEAAGSAEEPVEEPAEELVYEEPVEEEFVYEEPAVESFADSPVAEEFSDDVLPWSESGTEDIDPEEAARLQRIAEIEAELAGEPYEVLENADDELDTEEIARQRRIAEIEAELEVSSKAEQKRQAKIEAREERKHKRAVDRHSRKGPPVYIPEEGVWDIGVDEYSLEDVLGEDE